MSQTMSQASTTAADVFVTAEALRCYVPTGRTTSFDTFKSPEYAISSLAPRPTGLHAPATVPVLSVGALFQPKLGVSNSSGHDPVGCACTFSVSALWPVAQTLVECRTCCLRSVCMNCASRCHTGHALYAGAPLGVCKCAQGTSCTFFAPPVDIASVAGHSGTKAFESTFLSALQWLLMHGGGGSEAGSRLASMTDTHGFVAISHIVSYVRDLFGLHAENMKGLSLKRLFRLLVQQQAMRVAKIGSGRVRISPRHPASRTVLQCAVDAVRSTGLSRAVLADVISSVATSYDVVVPHELFDLLSNRNAADPPRKGDWEYLYRTFEAGGPTHLSGYKRVRAQPVGQSSMIVFCGPPEGLVLLSSAEEVASWAAAHTRSSGASCLVFKAVLRAATDEETTYNRIHNARDLKWEAKAGEIRVKADKKVQYLVLQCGASCVIIDVNAVAAGPLPPRVCHEARLCHATAAMSESDMKRAEAMSPLADIFLDSRLPKLSLDASEDLLFLQADLGLCVCNYVDVKLLLAESPDLQVQTSPVTWENMQPLLTKAMQTLSLLKQSIIEDVVVSMHGMADFISGNSEGQKYPITREQLAGAYLASALQCLRCPPHDPFHGEGLRFPILAPPWFMECSRCHMSGHFDTDCSNDTQAAV